MPSVRPHNDRGGRSDANETGSSGCSGFDSWVPTGSLGKRIHLKCMLPVRMERILRMTLLRGDMREVMSIQTSPHCTWGARTVQWLSAKVKSRREYNDGCSRQVRGTQCADATSLACISGSGMSGEVCRKTAKYRIFSYICGRYVHAA